MQKYTANYSLYLENFKNYVAFQILAKFQKLCKILFPYKLIFYFRIRFEIQKQERYCKVLQSLVKILNVQNQILNTFFVSQVDKQLLIQQQPACTCLDSCQQTGSNWKISVDTTQKTLFQHTGLFQAVNFCNFKQCMVKFIDCVSGGQCSGLLIIVQTPKFFQVQQGKRLHCYKNFYLASLTGIRFYLVNYFYYCIAEIAHSTKLFITACKSQDFAIRNFQYHLKAFNQQSSNFLFKVSTLP
eukprot:TRINITY_DN5458_c0_g1_i4.p1 TRINITY_DN5458_c0_g1~~TRINITY_DN5458_c0_g1_i4.p1  ORF type:complete len:242 (+),score=-21.59 TRINITY_DN5458_c0_g1_i4:339-1064(+)